MVLCVACFIPVSVLFHLQTPSVCLDHINKVAEWPTFGNDLLFQFNV